MTFHRRQGEDWETKWGVIRNVQVAYGRRDSIWHGMEIRGHRGLEHCRIALESARVG